VTLAAYVPGASPVHRLGAGRKAIVLLVACTAIFLVDRAVVAGLVLAGVLGLYCVADLPLRLAWEGLRPALPVLALLFAVQVWLDHWTVGALVAIRLAALLLLASLLMLTTRSSDLVEAIGRGLAPLAIVGVNPRKVGLAISLALRFIPVLAVITHEVREAQRTRGLEGSMLAVAVPVVVRTLKMADDVAAAIEARSYDP
jgi:biotin transport system permease protein